MKRKVTASFPYVKNMVMNEENKTGQEKEDGEADIKMEETADK